MNINVEYSPVRTQSDDLPTLYMYHILWTILFDLRGSVYFESFYSRGGYQSDVGLFTLSGQLRSS